MLRDYLQAAMHRATYEIIDDGRMFYGEIPGLQGVYAAAATLERCREELEEVLEGWVFFRLSRGLDIPALDGVELKVREVA